MLRLISGCGKKVCTSSRLGSHCPTDVIVAPAKSTSEAVNTTTWFGKILVIRRRQKARADCPGRADQVSTKPESTKKNDTPMYPVLRNAFS